eukprot:s9315_g2.t1
MSACRVVPKESVEQPSPTSTALEAERADLQRLREEVEAAAKDLERELQLLEEESAQMKLASSLKDEEARLHLQRRSLGMLQQAILKAADRPSPGGYVEHTMNDGEADGQDVLEVPERKSHAMCKCIICSILFNPWRLQAERARGQLAETMMFSTGFWQFQIQGDEAERATLHGHTDDDEDVQNASGCKRRKQPLSRSRFGIWIGVLSSMASEPDTKAKVQCWHMLSMCEQGPTFHNSRQVTAISYVMLCPKLVVIPLYKVCSSAEILHGAGCSSHLPSLACSLKMGLP